MCWVVANSSIINHCIRILVSELALIISDTITSPRSGQSRYRNLWEHYYGSFLSDKETNMSQLIERQKIPVLRAQGTF